MFRRVSATAGIAAPVLFFSLVIFLGLLEPGYSHRTKMMSVLGGVAGIRGLLFNAGVVLVGVLIVVFSAGFHRSVGGDGRGSKFGFILLGLGGFALAGTGAFPCNLNCANVIVEPDLVGRLHMIAALFSGMLLGLGPIFLYFTLRRDPDWRKYAGPTLLTGIFANLPGIIFWITLATVRLREVEGLLQRAGIVFVFLWMGAIGWALWSRDVAAP